MMTLYVHTGIRRLLLIAALASMAGAAAALPQSGDADKLPFDATTAPALSQPHLGHQPQIAADRLQHAFILYGSAALLHGAGEEDIAGRWAEEAGSALNPQDLLRLAQHARGYPGQFYAARYYMLAAEQGARGAAYEVARLYEDGATGMPRDRREAFRWYIQGAHAGDARAMAAVGAYLTHGFISAPNPVAGIHWYYRAARAGYAPAQTAYGQMLAEGLGAQRDIPEARYYLRLAAESGDARAIGMLRTLPTIAEHR